ncbi:MAG TPA: HRDC domain-containing protein, partial [Pseudoxanthomonas sp.]|nr:HRDC domain-containing protein [Pseudoxanthomonas sp.]
MRRQLPRKRDRERERRERPTGLSVLPQDLALFNTLRELRAGLAREQNLPPFMILHDSTLRAIAEHRPDSLDQLARINGIGGSKLTRYGEQVLQAVRGHA